MGGFNPLLKEALKEEKTRVNIIVTIGYLKVILYHLSPQ